MNSVQSQLHDEDKLVYLDSQVSDSEPQELSGSWPGTYVLNMQERTVVRTYKRKSLDEIPSPPSPWYDLTLTSPMITHCHSKAQPSEFPLRRIRSSSVGDARTMLVPDLPLLVEEGSRRSSRQSLLEDGDKDISVPTPSVPLEEGNPVWVSVMYGLINSTIVLPVLMSFGNIIYSDVAFAPYMPVLIKLTVVSGMVHQFCFSTLSTLPFAVGQVQDAGLIFLSQMARTMAQFCKSRGHDDETMLATVTIGLGVATALLGCGLVILGKARLAQFVQALPTPVVGGYLAFIGWFCGKSGLALMGGSSELTWQIIKMRWIYLLPGVVGGLLIYVLVRRLRHMAVLPACIAVILLSFYFVLWVSDTTIEDATDSGWIPETDAPPVWYHTWDYLKFDKVVWAALPQQGLTLVSMIFVVAVSSSLDVAAIELELKRPLDYNRELTMVGISNIVSGCTAGYTGSYIFSQSIFSLRAGIRSRLMGYVIALCELVVLLVPFPVLSVVPSFFFGSLLVMICVDLMYEWLWEVRTKLTNAEYAICVGTFLSIQVFGIELGILAGVAMFIIGRRIGVNLGSHMKHTEPNIEPEKTLQISENTAIPMKGKNYGATASYNGVSS